MASLFSDNFDWFLHALQPHSAPKGRVAYPAGLAWQYARIAGNETPRDMLQRCVNSAGAGDVRCCQVEADLAVIAFVQWENGTTLASANIQAIKTVGVDIQTYFASTANHQFQYFRLDVERRTGLIFTHPFPHVHYVPRGEIRYSLNGWDSDNVVIDFLEHIYLQCYHPWWLSWATKLWNHHWTSTGNQGNINPFVRIVDAFKDSRYEVLDQYQEELRALKAVLRRKKDDSYRLRIDSGRRALLGYPCG